MPSINIYLGESDLKSNVSIQVKGGAWVTHRPTGFNGFLHHARCIFLLMTGRADIVLWELEENKKR